MSFTKTILIVLASVSSLGIAAGRTRAQMTWYADDDNCPGPGAGTPMDPFCHIQGGIDAATDGDTVVVLPGLYVENINFGGKALSLQSTDPSNPDVVASTVIDGNGSVSFLPVVTFESGEDLTSVLQGFTVRGGYSRTEPGMGSCRASAAGIYAPGASPTILANVVNDNAGNGISVSNSNALIHGNTIRDNNGVLVHRLLRGGLGIVVALKRPFEDAGHRRTTRKSER